MLPNLICHYYDKCLTEQLSKKRACFDSKCRASQAAPLLRTYGKAKHVVEEATYLMVVKKRDTDRETDGDKERQRQIKRG